MQLFLLTGSHLIRSHTYGDHCDCSLSIVHNWSPSPPKKHTYFMNHEWPAPSFSSPHFLPPPTCPAPQTTRIAGFFYQIRVYVQQLLDGQIWSCLAASQYFYMFWVVLNRVKTSQFLWHSIIWQEKYLDLTGKSVEIDYEKRQKREHESLQLTPTKRSPCQCTLDGAGLILMVSKMRRAGEVSGWNMLAQAWLRPTQTSKKWGPAFE